MITKLDHILMNGPRHAHQVDLENIGAVMNEIERFFAEHGEVYAQFQRDGSIYVPTVRSPMRYQSTVLARNDMIQIAFSPLENGDGDEIQYIETQRTPRIFLFEDPNVALYLSLAKSSEKPYSDRCTTIYMPHPNS